MLLCILVIIIFVIVNIIATKNNSIEEATSTEETYNNTQEENIDNNETKNIEEKIEEWKIEIPEIYLTAKISEGTDEQILNEFVGHFILTPKEEGNIGLAAHNRGYPVNYFANLKKLKKGAEIIYTYGEFRKTYVVDKTIQISETDWSHLENSNQNKITLITCIENQPEYRLCVQATEKEEN